MSELKLDFDFGTYDLENVVGRKAFTIKYHMHEYTNGRWVDLGYYQSDRQYFISIHPRPFYKVFVSRGLRTEDRAIEDPIVRMIREWVLIQ